MNDVNTVENQLAMNRSALEGKDKHFIDDAIFKKLLAIREEIYQQTDINVSPRKLVNLLLEQSDFEALRDQLIKQYS